ncbi:hypothetical protein E5288_WYG017084 [Bos mutus]|uniref:Uncharacterized protein n=1 Tax=Bos mutus TaxID=72004 RepID=A0A6B0RDR6_9CETA|nr:hypothetical protein [Bos mutus]
MVKSVPPLKDVTESGTILGRKYDFEYGDKTASSSLVEKFPFADVEGQGAENMESRKRDGALHVVRITHVDTIVASEGLLQEPMEAIRGLNYSYNNDRFLSRPSGLE